MSSEKNTALFELPRNHSNIKTCNIHHKLLKCVNVKTSAQLSVR